jgi:hypothetical protein
MQEREGVGGWMDICLLAAAVAVVIVCFYFRVAMGYRKTIILLGSCRIGWMLLRGSTGITISNFGSQKRREEAGERARISKGYFIGRCWREKQSLARRSGDESGPARSKDT